MPGSGSFGAELRAWRVRKGLSLSQLSTLVHYDKGHLSRVERGLIPSVTALAKACDTALNADGKLYQLHDIAEAKPTAGPKPAQLPAAPTTFVGRSYHLGRMTGLLGDDKHPGSVTVVAIDGTPGVGKTSLALRWAHSVRDRFPDGVLFAALDGYGPDASPAASYDVLEGFLRALGVAPDRIPAEESHRAALYRSLLHQRRMLVVLDNAVDSRQVRPLLPGSESCVVVTTSRHRLSGLVIADAAVCLTLNPLSVDEAAELIRSIIGPRRADTDPGAVASITQRCSYLPLALRIAAERLVAHPQLAVSELATDLIGEADRLNVLTAGDDDTLALRAVFSWSYRALDDSEARLFRLLSLHRGPFLSTEAVAALSGDTVARTRRLLTRLVEAHLVEQAGPGAYRLLGLLRLYATDLVEDTDTHEVRATAVSRLVRWYLHSAHSAFRVLTPHCPHLNLGPPRDGLCPWRFADYNEATAWCEAELPNFTSILQAARQAGLNTECWQLAVALFGFFLLRKPWGIWLSTQLVGVEAARAAGNELAESWVLTNLGEACRQQHQLDEAQGHFDRALNLSRAHPGSIGYCWGLAGIGYVAMDRKQYAAASNALAEAVMRFRASGYTYGEATALAALGDAHRGQSDLDRAMVFGKQALELFRSLDDRKAQGDTLIRLVRTATACGEFAQAHVYCADALAAHRECGDRWSEADDIQEKGNILYLGDDDLLGAQKCWRAALEIFEDIDRFKATQLRELLSQ
ncbi:ATP-binding protein [Crossiella sp. CA198]|uniref:ATP-binding protein n=1 Tax=Crossiella sp. CA198 TaxID=3455607 RepID=UPI003F8D0007